MWQVLTASFVVAMIIRDVIVELNTVFCLGGRVAVFIHVFLYAILQLYRQKWREKTAI